jgi:hypothetical protein
MRGDNMDNNKPKEEAITLDETLDDLMKFIRCKWLYRLMANSALMAKFFGMTDEEIREECQKIITTK